MRRATSTPVGHLELHTGDRSTAADLHADRCGILLEPREGPAGWRSVVSTSAGGEVAFWQLRALTPARAGGGR